MAGPEQPRRRFAPVPIETSFKKSKKLNDQPPFKNRRIGPEPELTPEPSPRSPSPKPMELASPLVSSPTTTRPRRRFAPQLVETSRRSRRVGDKGPATRPTDKTDITPYTRNIYTATKHRRRHGGANGNGNEDYDDPMPPTRRETEDEGVKEYLLELIAKEAERKMQEKALEAFPNSRAREGGVDHYYFRESSESDEASEETSLTGDGHHRRQSSDLGINWWHQHMQQHAKQTAHDKQEEQHDDAMDVDVDEAVAPQQDKDEVHSVKRTDSDLDRMDLTAPPDPMWITTNKQASPTAARREALPGPRGPIGESFMPLITPDPFLADRQKDKPALPAPVPTRPIGESAMPFIPSAPVAGRVDLPFARPGQIPADTGGFRNNSPFGRPFGGLGAGPRPPTSRFHQRQKQVSPPMLGKEIQFRRCPSPKQTKLEPDHAFSQKDAAEKNRDLSGKGGLWRGYCYRSGSNDDPLVPASLQAPQPISTPKLPATPGEEMDGMYWGFHAPSKEPAKLPPLSGLWTPREHRGRHGEAKGLHMLYGIEERLQKEKAQVELDEKISQEFDDAFVTQVYNYLSLGYPATARAFDEELSKISRIATLDLEEEDEKRLAKGHLLEEDNSTPAEDRCPRWKALKKYITEWARQHPDLDNLEPSGWGVRERRGSWAI